jgi:hypothetical protein
MKKSWKLKGNLEEVKKVKVVKGDKVTREMK